MFKLATFGIQKPRSTVVIPDPFLDLLADMELLDAKVLFVIDEKNEKFVKSAANVPTVKVRHPGNASVYEVVEADELVLTEAAAKALEQKLAK